MLYEPPKTKKYIIVGSVAIVLAVLVIVTVPLLYRQKTFQAPVTNLSPQQKLQQQKIQKEFQKLEAMRKNMNLKQPTQEEIQKEFDELGKQRAVSGAIEPTQEQIQAEFNKLEKMKK